MYIPILPMIGGKESAAQGRKGTQIDGRFSISHMWPQEHSVREDYVWRSSWNQVWKLCTPSFLWLELTHVHSYLQEILEILF